MAHMAQGEERDQTRGGQMVWIEMLATSWELGTG